MHSSINVFSWLMYGTVLCLHMDHITSYAIVYYTSMIMFSLVVRTGSSSYCGTIINLLTALVIAFGTVKKLMFTIILRMPCWLLLWASSYCHPCLWCLSNNLYLVWNLSYHTTPIINLFSSLPSQRFCMQEIRNMQALGLRVVGTN